MCDIISIRKLVTLVMIVFVGMAPGIALARPPAPAAPPADCYCGECGMHMRGEGLKFASEIIFISGKTVYFCDLGDLFQYYEVLKKKQDVAAIYVKDYPTGAWADARACFYLADSGVVTPMRYGILAFKDKAGAEGFRKKNGGGAIYTFDGLAASRVYKR